MIQKRHMFCEICGLDHSSSGRPFDGPSLAKHMTVVHRKAPASDAKPLACDICGATAGGRGRKFLTEANLLQHKAKSHPESVGPAPRLNGSDKRQLPPRKAHNGKQSVAVAAATHNGSHLKFCPHCGFNLEVVHAAMDFVNGGTHS